MVTIPTSEYVEFRDPGYYLSGTRISLASIACAVRRGETIEQILADFPALESRGKLEGAVAFIEAHPDEVDAYLAEKAKRWEESEKLNPPEFLERLQRHREGSGLKSA